MKRMTILAVALWASVAQAEPGPLRLALNLGSLGAGPEITYRPSRWIAVRGGVSLVSLGHHHDIEDIRYTGHLRLRNAVLMADVHPFGDGWRLSAGVGHDSNRLRLKAMPMMAVVVGNRTYTPAQIGTLRGQVETDRDYAPIVTIGYAGPVASHFSIGGDIGVMFHGRPQMGPLTASTNLISPTDLAIERDKIQQDIGKYRYYPVVQLSAGYRF